MRNEYVVEGPPGTDPYHARTPSGAEIIAEDRLPTGHDGNIRVFTSQGTGTDRDLRVSAFDWATDQLPALDAPANGEWVSVHTQAGDWVRISATSSSGSESGDSSVSWRDTALYAITLVCGLWTAVTVTPFTVRSVGDWGFAAALSIVLLVAIRELAATLGTLIASYRSGGSEA